MIHYWKADCIRITKRVPRLVLTLAILVFYSILLVKASGKDSWNSVVFLSKFMTYMAFSPVVLGMIELAVVYADDLSCRNMQVGIGMGFSRKQVVRTKYWDVAYMSLVDLVSLALTQTVIACATGAAPKASQLRDIVAVTFSSWIMMLAYFAIASAVILLLQNASIGILLYLLLSVSLVCEALKKVFNFALIRNLHLERFLLTTLIGKLQAQLMIGKLAYGCAAGVVIYIVAFYALTSKVYQHRELEL